MSQAPGRPPRPSVDDTDIKVRNRRMLLVGVVMVALAFVVAAGYWYTHQPGKAPAPPTALSVKNVNGQLVIGPLKARHHVVITEAFTCGRCAVFERSVQAFLRADAAAGIVQIRYVIPVGSDTLYDVALASSPSRALSIHDQLFTQGSATGSKGTLEVVLDGKPLTQTDPLDLANALESALAQ
ncbi:MAG: thioredoxin domain-containing protein [Marmoricola sp.]